MVVFYKESRATERKFTELFQSVGAIPVCGCESIGSQFCNYAYGQYGYCMACNEVPMLVPEGCHMLSEVMGLPAAGVADCEHWCFGQHPTFSDKMQNILANHIGALLIFERETLVQPQTLDYVRAFQ